MTAAAFAYSDLLPTGPDETPYRLLTDRGRLDRRGRRPDDSCRSSPRRCGCSTDEAMHDIAHFLRPAHLAQLRRIIDDPEASRQRPLRRAGPAEERQHRRRRRAADVPGHRHRDRDGQEAERVLTGADDAECDQPRRVRRLHRAQPALLAARAADDVGREEHRHQPAGADRDLLDADGEDVDRRTSSSSWPRAAARRTSPSSTRRRRRC